MSDPLAYFITFTSYGTRMHGGPDGSVERIRDGTGTLELDADARRERHETSLLLSEPVTFDERQRAVVADAMHGVARHRAWQLWALNVRTNHVHVVVSAAAAPEQVMNTLKAWSTRRLREAGQDGGAPKLWTRHGSTRYLWSERDIEGAVQYVLEAQGGDLGGVRGSRAVEADLPDGRI
ncbi:MAG: transposase [Dehalococcoidia bacterium]|jgi:REP element-mobilizing transposase RayT